MRDPDITQIQKERECAHPFQMICPLFVQIFIDRQGLLNLIPVTGNVPRHERAIIILDVIEDAAILMVTHDCQGITRFDHSPDKEHGFPDFGSPVDKIAHKNDFSPGLRPTAILPAVTQFREKLPQQRSISMNVSNDILSDHTVIVAPSGGRPDYT